MIPGCDCNTCKELKATQEENRRLLQIIREMSDLIDHTIHKLSSSPETSSHPSSGPESQRVE